MKKGVKGEIEGVVEVQKFLNWENLKKNFEKFSKPKNPIEALLSNLEAGFFNSEAKRQDRLVTIY